MQTPLREKIALTLSIAVLGLAVWFWSGQIQDVLELLEMAYG